MDAKEKVEVVSEILDHVIAGLAPPESLLKKAKELGIDVEDIINKAGTIHEREKGT